MLLVVFFWTCFLGHPLRCLPPLLRLGVTALLPSTHCMVSRLIFAARNTKLRCDDCVHQVWFVRPVPPLHVPALVGLDFGQVDLRPSGPPRTRGVSPIRLLSNIPNCLFQISCTVSHVNSFLSSCCRGGLWYLKTPPPACSGSRPSAATGFVIMRSRPRKLLHVHMACPPPNRGRLFPTFPICPLWLLFARTPLVFILHFLAAAIHLVSS